MALKRKIELIRFAVKMTVETKLIQFNIIKNTDIIENFKNPNYLLH